jgi:hypothetical protein
VKQQESPSTKKLRRGVVSDKAGVLDIERGQPAAIRPNPADRHRRVQEPWGYVTNQDYKTADSIVVTTPWTS